jgi:hypothetical protein
VSLATSEREQPKVNGRKRRACKVCDARKQVSRGRSIHNSVRKEMSRGRAFQCREEEDKINLGQSLAKSERGQQVEVTIEPCNARKKRAISKSKKLAMPERRRQGQNHCNTRDEGSGTEPCNTLQHWEGGYPGCFATPGERGKNQAADVTDILFFLFLVHGPPRTTRAGLL